MIGLVIVAASVLVVLVGAVFLALYRFDQLHPDPTPTPMGAYELHLTAEPYPYSATP